MGFFDRIGNLGKGMFKVWTAPEGERKEQERKMKALDEELTRPAADRPEVLAKLHRARQNGLLTEEEHQRKRALALGLPASTPEPTADPFGEPPPVKRTL